MPGRARHDDQHQRARMTRRLIGRLVTSACALPMSCPQHIMTADARRRPPQFYGPEAPARVVRGEGAAGDHVHRPRLGCEDVLDQARRHLLPAPRGHDNERAQLTRSVLMTTDLHGANEFVAFSSDPEIRPMITVRVQTLALNQRVYGGLVGRRCLADCHRHCFPHLGSRR